MCAVVLLVWTKASPQAFLPHLEALATQVGELWEQGRIRAGGRADKDGVARKPKHTRRSLTLSYPTVPDHATSWLAAALAWLRSCCLVPSRLLGLPPPLPQARRTRCRRR